jgi:hypothetical protein
MVVEELFHPTFFDPDHFLSPAKYRENGIQCGNTFNTVQQSHSIERKLKTFQATDHPGRGG